MIYEKIRIRGELEKQQNSNTKGKTMETPRTDQAAFEANFSGTVFKVVDAYFARQLETELAAAKAKLRELRKKINEKKENEKLPVVG
ncbi:MAG: hypothetical protein PHV05_12965 [Candidatus Riflebacteria bacterium]|nr:hypothetical protein [Candidatus Riflebacteria bacterium]